MGVVPSMVGVNLNLIKVVQQSEAAVKEAAQPAKVVSALQLSEASRELKQLCISTFFQAKSQHYKPHG